MRDDRPEIWDEPGTLLAVFDYTRATVRAKCEGLTQAHAAANPLPTSPLTSIAGIVSHLRWVECSWLEGWFLGEDPEYPWTDEDPDREFRIAPDIPIAQLLDEYDAQSARYVSILHGDLDARAVRAFKDGTHPTLRWIVLHLIEETARHNGHLDILRELADGSVGS